MGIFSNLRRKKETEVRSIINRYYGGNYNYFVWNYASNMINIPEVRKAIEKISKIFSIMPIYHSRTDKKGNKTYLNDSMQRVLELRSNPLQNGSQFIQEAVNKLLINNNLFIEPIYDTKNGNLLSLWNLPTKSYNFLLSNNNKNAYVQFLDGQGNVAEEYNMENIIYLNRFVNLAGGEKNDLGLYETVLKSLGEKIVNDADPNRPKAILQSTTPGASQLKERDVSGVVKTATMQFDTKANGISYIDKGWSITPINWNENDVNKTLMQFITEIVYEYFDINENIINGTATEIEMATFVKTTIEPIAKMFEKEFSSKLFTPTEIDYGHRIEFDYNTIKVVTMQQAGNFIQTAIRNGVFNIDDAREFIGYPPIRDGLGQIYRASADLVNIEIIDDYELGKVGETVSTVENAADINLEKEETNETTDK